MEGLKKGSVREAFGTGTAATIAPIESIGYEGTDHPLPPTDKAGFASKVYEELEGIKHGKRPDTYNWVVKM